MGKTIRNILAVVGTLWLGTMIFLGVGGSYLSNNPEALIPEGMVVNTDEFGNDVTISDVKDERCRMARDLENELWSEAVDRGQIDEYQSKMDRAKAHADRVCAGRE